MNVYTQIDYTDDSELWLNSFSNERETGFSRNTLKGEGVL